MERMTIDLKQEAEEIKEEDIPPVIEAREELVNELENEFDDYKDVPHEYERAYEKLEEKRIELEGQQKALERAADEWGDGIFVIQELTMGQLATIQDSVSEKSFEWDAESGEPVSGTPKQGYGMVETIRQSIVQYPDSSPTRNDEFGNEEPDPAQYPHQVGLYLFEKINSFNTIGDSELGNSSLRDRMKT